VRSKADVYHTEPTTKSGEKGKVKSKKSDTLGSRIGKQSGESVESVPKKQKMAMGGGRPVVQRLAKTGCGGDASLFAELLGCHRIISKSVTAKGARGAAYIMQRSDVIS